MFIWGEHQTIQGILENIFSTNESLLHSKYKHQAGNIYILFLT
jgi:hypothetical protein